MTKLGVLGLAAGGCGDGSPFYALRPKPGTLPEDTTTGPAAPAPDMGKAGGGPVTMDPRDALPAPDASCAGYPVPDAANNLAVDDAYLFMQYVPEQQRPVYAQIVRSQQGFMALSANCTHNGCLTQWNPGTKTFDCGCHGSRFNMDGTVLNGPAAVPLPEHPLCRTTDGALQVDLNKLITR